MKSSNVQDVKELISRDLKVLVNRVSCDDKTNMLEKVSKGQKQRRYKDIKNEKQLNLKCTNVLQEKSNVENDKQKELIVKVNKMLYSKNKQNYDKNVLTKSKRKLKTNINTNGRTQIQYNTCKSQPVKCRSKLLSNDIYISAYNESFRNKSSKENRSGDHRLKLDCKVVLDKLAEGSDRIINNVSKYKCKFNSQNVSAYSTDNVGSNQNKISNQEEIVSKPQIVHSTPIMALRKINKKNYAELTLNNSEEVLGISKQTPAEKVPIYKQHIEGGKIKKMDDLYEFDESDPDITKNVAKKKSRPNKSRKMDRTMYDILEKIEMKERRLKCKNRKNKPIKKSYTSKKYNETVHEIIQKVMGKVKNNSSERRQVTSLTQETVIVPKSNSENVNPAHVNCITTTSKNLQNFNTINAQILKAVIDIPNVLGSSTLEKEIEVVGGVTNEDLRKNIPIEQNSEEAAGQNYIEDKYYGFDPDNQHTPTKINIISDVTLNENNLEISFQNSVPNANSTLLPVRNFSPWRFDENVKRNPHYINLKRSALPCIQQDMVLDYIQLEKFVEHFSKCSSKRETPQKKSTKQTSIQNFLTNASEDQENIPHSSLFDYDDFSPIKSKLRQNISNINKSKRNILAPKQDNTINTQNVTPPIRHDDEDLNYLTYFGFDDESEETLSKNNIKPVEARPFRIMQKRFVKETEKSKKEDILPVLQESMETPPECDMAEVKLFEDIEPNISLNVPQKIYDRKKRKRKIMTIETDDNEEEVHKKRPKKDMMTKAEEDEFEKWAADFNSKCEEIEKYELEID